MSEVSTTLSDSVARIGRRTLRLTNYGKAYIRLRNRTNDVEYEISLLSVPKWIQHLTDDRKPATVSTEDTCERCGGDGPGVDYPRHDDPTDKSPGGVCWDCEPEGW